MHLLHTDCALKIMTRLDLGVRKDLNGIFWKKKLSLEKQLHTLMMLIEMVVVYNNFWHLPETKIKNNNLLASITSITTFNGLNYYLGAFSNTSKQNSLLEAEKRKIFRNEDYYILYLTVRVMNFEALWVGCNRYIQFYRLDADFFKAHSHEWPNRRNFFTKGMPATQSLVWTHSSRLQQLVAESQRPAIHFEHVQNLATNGYLRPLGSLIWTRSCWNLA